MDDLPPYSAVPMHIHFIDRAAPSTRQPAPLTARPDSTYASTTHRVEALARDLSAQSLEPRDGLDHSPLAPTMARTTAEPATIPRLDAISISSFLFHDEDDDGFSGDSMDDVTNNPHTQEGTPSPTTIEPDESSRWNLPIDEGYGEGDDDFTWMQWPTTAEAEQYVGCQMKNLLHFRTAAEAALQCSTLVYKAPRMRKRKHRAGDLAHQQSMACGVRDGYHGLKRVRQA
ncbi:hypothetical protein HJFPF1_03698 [Paramyrothecium foliicola]|nr:hypothetical protein HJFPF1_03698 [Paramyrothecium foliicola]